MSRPYSLPRLGIYIVIFVAIFVGSLLMGGLLLPIGEIAYSTFAQELPPRPTLTPEESDDDEVEATPAATATLAPTVAPTLTATPLPPTPMTMPVTGSRAGGGQVWVALGIGLILSVVAGAVGAGRALPFLRGKRTKPNGASK